MMPRAVRRKNMPNRCPSREPHFSACSAGDVERARHASILSQAARLSRSTFSPSDFSSFTSTLKLSGTPASNVSCSRTIAS